MKLEKEQSATALSGMIIPVVIVLLDYMSTLYNYSIYLHTNKKVLKYVI